MTTTQLPEGWYTILGQTTAHHAADLIGAAVRPACSMIETPGDQTRPPKAYDTACRNCIRDLVDHAVDLNLPAELVQCLGCGRLHPHNGRQALIEHTGPADCASARATDTGEDEEPRCFGSEMPAAQHDGRDPVRREAIFGLDRVRDRLRTQRFHLSQSIERGWSLADALRNWGHDLVRFEALHQLWDVTLDAGDYLTGAYVAVSFLVPDADDGPMLPSYAPAARIAAAREWIAGSGVRIGDELAAPGRQDRLPGLIREIISLLDEYPSE